MGYDMSNDICGYEKDNGVPCQLPDSRPDGRCHHHTEATEEEHSGRPSKLSHKRQEQIATALEAGVSFKAACEAVGIHRETGYRWMRKGEQQDAGEYCDFHDRITRARGIGKLELSNTIVEIAKERQDARTLLKYLQHIEGGEASQEDELAEGINVYLEAEQEG